MREPLPTDPQGKRLCQLFSYRWNTIEGTTTDATNPDWKTITDYPLRPRVLWIKFQDAGQLVGVRFGTKTQYALIDIDEGSPYLDRIVEIRAALETIGITRTVPIRSSWSGGLHLYIPLPAPVRTFDLACTLHHCLESQGLELGPGQLEIFPNIKSHGAWWKGEFTEYNAHRLPLQPGSGSCLLDNSLQPIGGDLQRFFWAWDIAAIAQDMGCLTEALRIGRDSQRKRRRRRATHPVKQWRDDLELEIGEGWSDYGQTNGLLKSIACYGRVFEGLAGAELAAYVERIATSRPGYERWCRHHHDIRLRCKVWARAAEKYYWPLGTEPKRETPKYCPNAERAAEARDRIATAMRSLRFDGLSVRELVAQLCRLAHCSAQTLYRHLDLWHPNRSPVTDATTPVTGNSTTPTTGPPASDESRTSRTVTPDGGRYEGCGAETCSKKFLTLGERGGCGGREGVSTDG